MFGHAIRAGASNQRKQTHLMMSAPNIITQDGRYRSPAPHGGNHHNAARRDSRYGGIAGAARYSQYNYDEENESSSDDSISIDTIEEDLLSETFGDGSERDDFLEDVMSETETVIKSLPTEKHVSFEPAVGGWVKSDKPVEQEENHSNVSKNTNLEGSNRAAPLILPKNNPITPVVTSPNGDNVNQTILPIDDSEEMIAKTDFYLDPDGAINTTWTLFISILVLYICIELPWRICFSIENEILEFFDYGLDLFFGVDLIINFFVAFRDENNTLITDRKQITIKYLKFWFWVDLLALIPYGVIVGWISPPNSTASLNTIDGNSADYQAFRLVRITRLLRLLKLLRMLKLSKIMKNFEETVNINPSIIRLLNLLLRVLFVAHLLACLWYFIGYQEYLIHGSSWITSANIVNSNVDIQYITSIYWTIATLTSIGYGDITATTTVEQVYAIFCMCAGASVFGFIIANISTLIESLDLREREYKDRFGLIKKFLKENDHLIPHKLAQDISKYFHYYFSRKSAFDENRILNDLSPDLRLLLLQEANKDVISRLAIFEKESSTFMTECMLRMKPIFFTAKSFIAIQGEIGQDMFFLDHGIVDVIVTSKEGSSLVVGRHADGSHFGELSLLKQLPRTATLRAFVDCDMLSISYTDLHELLDVFPDSKQRMEERVQIQIQTMQNKMLEKAESGDEFDINAIPEFQRSATALFREGDNNSGDRFSIISEDSIHSKSHKSIYNLRDILASKSSSKFLGKTDKSSNNGRGGVSWKRQVAIFDQMRRWTKDEIVDSILKMELETFSKSAKERSYLESANVIIPKGLDSWVIKSDNRLKLIWDMYIAVLIIWIIIVIPIRIGFEAETSSLTEVIIDIVIDVSFCIDIILSFFTTYEDKLGRPVSSLRNIGVNYLKNWFFIDLISIFPFESVFNSNASNTSTSVDSRSGASSIQFIKSIRLLRILKVLRIIKLGPIWGAMEDIRDRYVNPAVTQLLKLAVQTFFIAHLLGCVFAFVGIPDGTYHNLSWLRGAGIDQSSVTDRYIGSLYWAFSTMTTVGYGDFVPFTPSEIVYCTFSMLLGATIFGYAIGSMSSIIYKLNATSLETKAMIDEAKAYLREKNISRPLALRVIRYFEYCLAQREEMDKDVILDNLSTHLRHDLILALHKSMISSVPFFKNADSEITVLLISKLQSWICVPGDYLFREGDIGYEMFFLVKGVVEVIKTTQTPRSSSRRATFRVPSSRQMSIKNSESFRKQYSKNHSLTPQTIPEENTINNLKIASNNNKTNKNESNEEAVEGEMEKVQYLLKKGAYFGEMALLSLKTQRSAGARAYTYCNLYALNRDDLKSIRKKYPLLAAKVYETLQKSLKTLLMSQETASRKDLHVLLEKPIPTKERQKDITGLISTHGAISRFHKKSTRNL